MLFYFFREKNMRQEQEFLKKQIQCLTEDLNKHTTELMNARREHNTKLLTLQTQVSQKTEEVNCDIITMFYWSGFHNKV